MPRLVHRRERTAAHADDDGDTDALLGECRRRSGRSRRATCGGFMNDESPTIGAVSDLDDRERVGVAEVGRARARRGRLAPLLGTATRMTSDMWCSFPARAGGGRSGSYLADTGAAHGGLVRGEQGVLRQAFVRRRSRRTPPPTGSRRSARRSRARPAEDPIPVSPGRQSATSRVPPILRRRRASQ